MALLEDNLKLRSAKVISKTDCHFLCMERNYYRLIFGYFILF